MFYGSPDRSGSAEIERTSVAVYGAGAGGGTGVPPADAGGVAAQSGSGGSDGSDHGACVPALWPDHEPQGYAASVVAGPVWQAQRTGFAFRVSSLPRAVPTPAGSAGRGTGAYQRFSCAVAGSIGGSGPLCTGIASGMVAVGGGGERHERLACGAAFRASGRRLQRGSQRVSCRQPYAGRREPWMHPGP
jgi:hypothetical protein